MFFLSPHFTLLLSVSTSDLSLYSFFFSVHLCFQQVRANLARLRSCVEELRSIPGEGCIRGAARGGELLRQAVLDSLQQFKQYIRHTCTGNQSGNNTSVEVSRDRTFICTTSTTIFFFAWSSPRPARPPPPPPPPPSPAPPPLPPPLPPPPPHSHR